MIITFFGCDILSRKFLIIFSIFLILTPISAVELHEYDFDGFFKMDVPYNDSFTKDSILIDPDIHGTVIFHNLDNQINVTHFYRCSNMTFVNETVENLRINPDVVIVNDGNLSFVNVNDTNCVLYQNESKVVMISSTSLDFDSLRMMIGSLRFEN